jgi:hypothetical protein
MIINKTVLDSLAAMVPTTSTDLPLRTFWILFDLLWAAESARVQSVVENSESKCPPQVGHDDTKQTLRETVLQTLFVRGNQITQAQNVSITCLLLALFDSTDPEISPLLQLYGGNLIGVGVYQ